MLSIAERASQALRGCQENNRPMPSPPKTTHAEIVRVARKLLDRDGREAFSLNDVAATVGVKTPSLYGHFENRAALLLAVELTLWAELKAALTKAANNRDPVR